LGAGGGGLEATGFKVTELLTIMGAIIIFFSSAYLIKKKYYWLPVDKLRFLNYLYLI